jgi:hypothetical protein
VYPRSRRAPRRRDVSDVSLGQKRSAVKWKFEPVSPSTLQQGTNCYRPSSMQPYKADMLQSIEIPPGKALVGRPALPQVDRLLLRLALHVLDRTPKAAMQSSDRRAALPEGFKCYSGEEGIYRKAYLLLYLWTRRAIISRSASLLINRHTLSSRIRRGWQTSRLH